MNEPYSDFNQPNEPQQAPPAEPTQPAPPTIQQPPLTTPWVSYTILAVTILVYLGQIGSQFLLGYDLPAALGMKVNILITNGEFWRLFTPMLLHGSILHIGFNMYALYVIGPDLERYFGPTRFSLLYLVSGFAGNVASMALTQQNSLGASTAIFGLLGAQGVFIYQNRALFGARGRALLNRILYLAFLNLVIGLQAGIDNWGHLGGLIGGVLYTWFAGPLFALEGIHPLLRVVDKRDPSAGLVTAAGEAVLFGAVAVAIIISRLL